MEKNNLKIVDISPLKLLNLEGKFFFHFPEREGDNKRTWFCALRKKRHPANRRSCTKETMSGYDEGRITFSEQVQQHHYFFALRKCPCVDCLYSAATPRQNALTGRMLARAFDRGSTARSSTAPRRILSTSSANFRRARCSPTASSSARILVCNASPSQTF
jgi:hypothetical protein